MYSHIRIQIYTHNFQTHAKLTLTNDRCFVFQKLIIYTSATAAASLLKTLLSPFPGAPVYARARDVCVRIRGFLIFLELKMSIHYTRELTCVKHPRKLYTAKMVVVYVGQRMWREDIIGIFWVLN